MLDVERDKPGNVSVGAKGDQRENTIPWLEQNKERDRGFIRYVLPREIVHSNTFYNWTSNIIVLFF